MPFNYENRFALTRSNAAILPIFTPCTIYHAVLVFDRISFHFSVRSSPISIIIKWISGVGTRFGGGGMPVGDATVVARISVFI